MKFSTAQLIRTLPFPKSWLRHCINHHIPTTFDFYGNNFGYVLQFTAFFINTINGISKFSECSHHKIFTSICTNTNKFAFFYSLEKNALYSKRTCFFAVVLIVGYQPHHHSEQFPPISVLGSWHFKTPFR